MSKLLTGLAQKNFADNTNTSESVFKSSEKALSQRQLRKEYTQDKMLNIFNTSKKSFLGAKKDTLAPKSSFLPAAIYWLLVTPC